MVAPFGSAFQAGLWRERRCDGAGRIAAMEPTEVHEFSKQMEEAGGAESLTRIALAISILAVLVALVTVLGHGPATDALLMQSRANDQWSEYQAKKIRQDNLQVVLDQMMLAPAPTAAAQAKMAEYRAHIDKWSKDLEESQAKAREDEAEVRLAERKGSRFDLAEALLQIGVVLASITLLTRKKTFFLLGLVLGVIGLAAAVSAMLLHG